MMGLHSYLASQIAACKNRVGSLKVNVTVYVYSL